MLTIIIASIISVISFIIIQNKIPKEEQVIDDDFEEMQSLEQIKYTIPEFILLVGLFIGIFVPVSGYEEPIRISTKNLVSYDNGEFIRYENSKIYYQIEERPPIWDEDKPIPIGEKSVKKKSTSVIPSITIPKIETYQRKGKQSILTFAIGVLKKEYKIYTP